MKSLEIDGIGTDVEPLPDAMVRRGTEGSQGVWPLTTSLMEEGGLRLAIGADRGIRGGSYLFRFAYSTDLVALGRIVRRDGVQQITFIGPRLTSGVDSAKVTFSIPRGRVPPRLVEGEAGGAQVLLGEVRRGAEHDEIELVRAHLATGEPAVWKIEVDADALAGLVDGHGSAHQLETLPSSTGTVSGSTWTGRSLAPGALGVIGAVGLLYGLLVFLKARSIAIAARLREARVKPLVPGPAWLRGAASATALASAGYFAVVQEPWIAVALLLPVICFATHLLPVRQVKPRGPGIWEALDASARPRALRLPGLYFETRTAPGFALFIVMLGAVFLAAHRMLPSSNYLSLMTMALVLPLLPLFFTGRLRDLPRDPVDQAAPWFRFLDRALDSTVAHVELWGRRATTESLKAQDPIGYDEVRIRIVLESPPSGLRSFEVSFDEAAGACVLPCVLLRVLEDSPTTRRLPADISWQRGRSAEERVTLLRPTAPTRAQLLRLVRSLLGNLRAVAHSDSRSVRSSAGRADSTAKAGTPLAAPAM